MVAIIYEFNGKQYVSATTYIKLEQENKKLNDKYNGLWKIYAEDVNKRVEENKKLKEELKKDDREVQVDVDKELLKANDYLIKENKKLKDNIAWYEKEEDRLREENRLLKNEIAWMKDHTKYNAITEEEYIDGTMTATEAKLRLQQAEANKKYVSNLEEENRKLKLHIEAKDKAYVSLLKDYEEIKEDRKKILDEIEAEIERFKAFRNR